MNKIKVGMTQSPNIKQVRSKVSENFLIHLLKSLLTILYNRKEYYKGERNIWHTKKYCINNYCIILSNNSAIISYIIEGECL